MINQVFCKHINIWHPNWLIIRLTIQWVIISVRADKRPSTTYSYASGDAATQCINIYLYIYAPCSCIAFWVIEAAALHFNRVYPASVCVSTMDFFLCDSWTLILRVWHQNPDSFLLTKQNQTSEVNGHVPFSNRVGEFPLLRFYWSCQISRIGSRNNRRWFEDASRFLRVNKVKLLESAETRRNTGQAWETGGGKKEEKFCNFPSKVVRLKQTSCLKVSCRRKCAGVSRMLRSWEDDGQLWLCVGGLVLVFIFVSDVASCSWISHRPKYIFLFTF